LPVASEFFGFLNTNVKFSVPLGIAHYHHPEAEFYVP